MGRPKKRYSPEFKARAVLELLKREKNPSQLGGELGVHPVVLSSWKRRFLEAATEAFEKSGKAFNRKQEDKEKTELFEQIGRLKMEVEWLKKKLGCLT